MGGPGSRHLGVVLVVQFQHRTVAKQALQQYLLARGQRRGGRLAAQGIVIIVAADRDIALHCQVYDRSRERFLVVTHLVDEARGRR